MAELLSASQYPSPTTARRARDEQAFVSQLFALESRYGPIGAYCRLSSVRRLAASWSISLAVAVTGARATSTTAVGDTKIKNQARPSVTPIDPSDAVASAFSRAIARDAARYVIARGSVDISPDEADPAPPEKPEDLYPELTAFRAQLGV